MGFKRVKLVKKSYASKVTTKNIKRLQRKTNVKISRGLKGK